MPSGIPSARPIVPFLPRRNPMPRALLILLASVVAAAGCENEDPTAPGDDPSGAGPAAVAPTVSTATVVGITTTSAKAGGDVKADGGATVTVRGVVWSPSPSPTVTGDRTKDGTGTGAFVSEIGSLSPGATYYVRAYATNSVGTAYGDEVQFTTEEGDYAIIVLGRVGNYGTLGNDVNEHCRVAGSYHRGNNIFGGYVWAPGTGFRDIGLSNASAFAINGEGTVTGHAVEGQADRAYTWTEAAGARLYPPPAGTSFTSSSATAINSHGVVVGASMTYGPQGVDEMGATLWRPDGEAVALRNHMGGWALARGISDAGVVVGYAGQNATAWEAPDEDPVLLAEGSNGQAWGINKQGVIVGVVGPQAAMWRGRQRTILAPLPGHAAATARAVSEPDANNVIRVVGWSEPTWWGPSVERRPVIWTVDRFGVGVEDLHPPAGHLSAFAKAVRIMQGEVVVVGTSYTSDSAFAVMWSTSREVCAP
jgi:hypothetical protein